jgi:lysyl-tRNA synthetase class 2
VLRAGFLDPALIMSSSARPSPWWNPQTHADRRPLLRARGRVREALRQWLLARDFTEVETAAIQISPGNETHLHAFRTELVTPAVQRQPLYLRTSPEFACKKLLAAGETRIFEFARVWRNRERGALHHPEFTMLEWYRAGEGYEVLMQDCAALLQATASAVGDGIWSFRGRQCDPRAPVERITVADAFHRFAGIDLLRTLDGPLGDRAALAKAAIDAGFVVAEDDNWGDIVSKVLVERIEPRLGIGAPVALCDYPLPMAALARPKPGAPGVAERFELYVCGVELANGFGELTDPQEQRRRFAADMVEKERIYGERYPVDEDFIAALAMMPQASGIALGFDRLVMLATGAPRIDLVMWTPVAEG